MNFENVYLEVLFGKNPDPKLIDLVFIHFKTNPDHFKTYCINYDENYYEDYYESNESNYYQDFYKPNESDYYQDYYGSNESDYYEDYYESVYYEPAYESDSSVETVHTVPYDFDIYDDC